MRTTAAVALLASLASPTAALAPVPAPHRAHVRGTHRPAAAHVWRAAERVYTEISSRTRALDERGRTRVARAIVAEAARTGLDPLLVVAMIEIESAYDPRAVSPAGAVGLMQLLEPTMSQVAARARLRTSDRNDPVANVQAGVHYVATLLAAFDDSDVALMAYNAGPNRIRRYLRDGEIPERLRAYPRNVKGAFRRLSAAAEPALARASVPVPIAAHAATPPHLLAAAALEPGNASTSEHLRDSRRAPRPVEPEPEALARALLPTRATPGSMRAAA